MAAIVSITQRLSSSAHVCRSMAAQGRARCSDIRTRKSDKRDALRQAVAENRAQQLSKVASRKESTVKSASNAPRNNVSAKQGPDKLRAAKTDGIKAVTPSAARTANVKQEIKKQDKQKQARLAAEKKEKARKAAAKKDAAKKAAARKEAARRQAAKKEAARKAAAARIAAKKAAAKKEAAKKAAAKKDAAKKEAAKKEAARKKAAKVEAAKKEAARKKAAKKA